MRFLFMLATAGFLLYLNPTGKPQVQMTREHSCESGNQYQPPDCEAAWEANVSAVFLGMATNVREEDIPIILDGERARTLRLHVTFRVDEAFRGVSDKVVVVISGGDLCGFPFSKGNKYLVYGRRLPSGEIYVSISSATKWAKDAADDLKYLRGLAAAPSGATIYGAVFRYTNPENPTRLTVVRKGAPAVGQKVQIQGSSQQYEATVDSDGHFRISALPAGRYTIVLNADGQVHASPPVKSTTVDVADKGCARFEFWVDRLARKGS